MKETDRFIKICWPNPDRVCLQGGCIYCQDNVGQILSEVRKYAKDKKMTEDFEYGLIYGNL